MDKNNSLPISTTREEVFCKEHANCLLAEYINHGAAAATFRAPPSVKMSMVQYVTTGTWNIQFAT